MGVNCGCLKQEREQEITISQQDSAANDKSSQPIKRPNWEDRFLELLGSLPIPSDKVKVHTHSILANISSRQN